MEKHIKSFRFTEDGLLTMEFIEHPHLNRSRAGETLRDFYYWSEAQSQLVKGRCFKKIRKIISKFKKEYEQ